MQLVPEATTALYCTITVSYSHDQKMVMYMARRPSQTAATENGYYGLIKSRL